MIKYFLVAVMIIASSQASSQSGISCDQYGGIKSIKGKKTGWFHVQELNGRWYFITPEGNAFFSLGPTHSVEVIKQDELNLWETRYKKDETKLAELYLSYFKEWGYNSSGYGPLPTMEKRIPYVASIWTEGPRSYSAGDKSTYSDIFDPVVQERLRKTVRTAVAGHRNNPYCLGYVFIDCPVWNIKPQRGISYIDFIRSGNQNSPGKKEYVKFLAGRYNNDIAALNKAYGTGFSSFDVMLSSESLTLQAKDNQSVTEDDEAFLVILADKYFSIAAGELRKADPDHLILGDRFMSASKSQPGLRVPDEVLKMAAKYLDVISFQPMGTTEMRKDYINHVNQITEKPVLLADVNTMTSRPYEGQTNTEEYEKSAGEHTINFYMDAAESPALIGIHRCTVRDYRPWDTNFHRRGLLKKDDTPYPLMVKYTIEANNAVYNKVYGLKVEK
jgi:hypothetical protein